MPSASPAHAAPVVEGAPGEQPSRSRLNIIVISLVIKQIVVKIKIVVVVVVVVIVIIIKIAIINDSSNNRNNLVRIRAILTINLKP